MKFAVIVFPGSNCDVDMYHAVVDALGEEAEYVPSSTTTLAGFDGVLLPGGFSYGDYLRCGAIARFAPVMTEVVRFAEEGKPVLGVCNGFQVLTEAGLLPGGLLQNTGQTFICDTVTLRVVNNHSLFMTEYEIGEAISIPVAHGEGNYVCSEETLKELQENNQIAFLYEENPNGSTADIAGITNVQGNVLGMMPHPERAVEELLGSIDGKRLFQSMIKNWRNQYAYHA